MLRYLMLAIFIAAAGFGLPTGQAQADDTTGTGLTGTYVQDDTVKLVRTDSGVNFSWGNGTPDASIDTGTFEVTWTGYIKPEKSGSYIFYFYPSSDYDETFNVWLNDQLIVKDKSIGTTYGYSSYMSLTAGESYSIRVEYTNNTSSDSGAKLRWYISGSTVGINENIPTRVLYPNDQVFFSDFESSGTNPTWYDTVDWSKNVGGYCCSLTHMESSPRTGETWHSGSSALMYSGKDWSSTSSYSYNKIYDVNLDIKDDTKITYWIYPQQKNGTYAAIDFIFTDGTSLRDSGIVDTNGVGLHPHLQGLGGKLTVNSWNRVEADLSSLEGKTVDRILIAYDQPANTGGYRGYVDDIYVGPLQ